MRAGAVEVTTAGDDDISPLHQAGNAGANFDAYDADGDGVVRSDELAVVVVNMFDDSCGQTRGVPCVRPIGSGVDVCLADVSFVGEHVSFATLAHELGHHLKKQWDTYGPDFNWNYRATMTAATCTGGNDTWTVHMDPWHKMAWGWIEPRIVNLNEPATLKSLNAPAAFGTAATQDKRPVILFDPTRGTRDYFLIETREPDGMYDADVADDGMAVWKIDLNEDLNPALVVVNAEDGSEVGYRHGVTLYNGPDLAGVAGPRDGWPRFFHETDGALQLSWSDGSKTEMTVEYGLSDRAPSTGFVQIGGDDVFRARIDDRRLISSRGNRVEIHGTFGLPGRRTVVIGSDEGIGERTPLDVESWLADGQIAVEVPLSTAPGRYSVTVQGPSPDTVSNPVEIEIVPTEDRLRVPPSS